MPAGSSLRSRWKPAEPIPLPEYPRPQMRRKKWINLNGWWQYAILPKGDQPPQTWQGEILVPYPLESLLSGVQKALLPGQKLWYQRTFADPRAELFNEEHKEEGGSALLHFGAVDHECEVWINGVHVGGHVGGYLPFSMDITQALVSGENELLVSVLDPSDSGLQPRGKQSLKPQGIWYTAVSGIWQTVWLEGVPGWHIERLKMTPDLEGQCLQMDVDVCGEAGTEEGSLLVEVSFSGKKVTSITGEVGARMIVPIPKLELWSPENPNLYDLQVRLVRGGRVVDVVDSYFAMRSFSMVRDGAGKARFALNGKPLFLYGPLDQGYHCDGLYTPASEEALLFDIEYARQIGCNLIRKHVKVEPLRWYYHCDRLGMIVWQDMPNGGLIDGYLVAGATQIFGFHRNDNRRLGRFGREGEANRLQFKNELQGMIEHLHNAACIAAWVPFNESWGQFEANEIAAWVKSMDPTRLVEHASGWFEQGGGDIQSRHIYFKKLKLPKPDRRAFLLTEFGGYSMKIPGHQWDETKKFGYRFFDSPSALTGVYLELLEKELIPLIPQGLAGAIYTQTVDVEIEINGYLTYDRQVEKMDAELLRKRHRELIQQASGKIT